MMHTINAFDLRSTSDFSGSARGVVLLRQRRRRERVFDCRHMNRVKFKTPQNEQKSKKYNNNTYFSISTPIVRIHATQAFDCFLHILIGFTPLTCTFLEKYNFLDL